MKEKYIHAFMDVAERFSQLSSAKKMQVGAIIVKDNRIISIGYNGMPAGWDNVCEDEIRGSSGGLPMSKLVTKPEVLHAERNALDKLARSSESGEGAVMFCTHAPCLECAKSIYGSGITKLYYKNDYRNVDGQIFLDKCNIEVEQV